MTTRDVKCSLFHSNENKKTSSTCCCIKYWNQTFEELLSTNGISSKLCALTVSPLFYPFPNFQQCGVLRLSKCIKSPTCGQPTNQPPPLYHNPSWMIIVLPCLNGWLRGLVANQRNHLDWNDGPSHRIVWPMVDNHWKPSGHKLSKFDNEYLAV